MKALFFNFKTFMKTINPTSEPLKAQRSFLIYGEPKAGKTSLALSVAELGKTVYIATEHDGWQDVYANLSPEAQANLTVLEIETLEDLKNIGSEVRKHKEAGAVVVDSFTALMAKIEEEIKNRGGKAVVDGLSRKLSLSSYGDLANIAIQVLKDLKATGKHVILTAGADSESVETDGGVTSRKQPLLTGAKTSGVLPYEVRAIGYLSARNGKRELWFQGSGAWMAGSNYPALTALKMMDDPSFAKLFSLFPKPKKDAANTRKDEVSVEVQSDGEEGLPFTE